MDLQLAETIIRWLGGLLAYVTLGVLLYGVWRGTQQPAGRTTGRTSHWLRSPWLYFGSSVFFFGVCYLAWIPLPWIVSTHIRPWMLALGLLFYFSGMSLALWGRLALGKYYFVSTGLGAQLFAGHQLVTSGPYALVRHPMYSGVFLASFGGLLIYLTWTTLFLVCFAPLLIARAVREEKVLAMEFGEQWQEYCRRVPMFIPQLRRKS